MIESRRQAYLEAMGFDVWVARPPPPEPGRLCVVPGKGSTLLVVGRAEDCERALAGDIARAVGGDPAWAWPDPEGKAENPGLEDTIRDGLFTQAIVFGSDVAGPLLGGDASRVIASAVVVVAADLDELATRGSAKQALWRQISQPVVAPSHP